MYQAAVRRYAVAELERGRSLRSLSIETGISRAALRDWLDHGIEPRRTQSSCPICNGELPAPADDYLYLLGLYLGDGCISAAPRTTVLRITCCDAWPNLMYACAAVIESVSGRKHLRVKSVGCHEIKGLWVHWPCLFPQHGRGRKHERQIWLADWQHQMVRSDPRPLIRGLIHSDGCRITNWTEQKVGGTVKRYTYPRYFFSNESDDIRGIFTDALDLLDIPWRQNRRNSISIARREAVAELDKFVGPKS